MSTLIVDDNAVNLTLMKTLAEQVDPSEVYAFDDPTEALASLDKIDFDLILVDYFMPAIDGIEFIERVRARRHFEEVPVVMVTTADQRSVRLEALEAGATDFLSKPIDPTEFKARVKNLLRLRAASRFLRDRAQWLAREVGKVTSALSAREEEIIMRLARAAEYRDAETGSHIVRMARYCTLIAEALNCPESVCRNIYLAAPMHDVGKIGISDTILMKPGTLTNEERQEMQRHATVGKEILEGSGSELVQLAAEIAASHHERWDGTGYPLGLRGDAIPLSGRIAAVADVFDALTSERPYKRAWTMDEAKAFLVEQSGKHFDPACIEAFLSRWDEVLRIRTSVNEEIMAA